jgi:DNA-binding LacI/PurR family transcriptional regulator
MEAFIRTAKSHAIEFLNLGPFEPEHVKRPSAAETVLESGATAAIGYNDLVVIGIITELHRRGVRPGRIFSSQGLRCVKDVRQPGGFFWVRRPRVAAGFWS